MAKEKPVKVGVGRFTYKSCTIKQRSTDCWIAYNASEQPVAEGKSLHDTVNKLNAMNN